MTRPARAAGQGRDRHGRGRGLRDGQVTTEFIGDGVEVRFARKPGPPTSFVWHGAEHEIAEVTRRWRTLDFRKPWWQRRHRDYYVVRTLAGEVFELYFHRGPGRRYWVLSKRLAG